MATPESRVKAALKLKLSDATLIDQSKIWVHWPVLNGMGSPEIDCNILYQGVAYAIECKAPGKTPTDTQWDTLRTKRRAGAWCYVLGGVWRIYRGRPLAEADPEDLELIMESILGGASLWKFSSAKEKMHDNWEKYGGTFYV